MSLELYNPNVITKPQTPEGHSGDNVFMFLPFYAYGYWSPSGRQLTFLGSEIPQRSSRPVMGLARPDTFRKDASSCPIAASVI